MADKAAARPSVPGASAVFLVGTRAKGVTDDFLDQARTWVTAIQAGVGTGVIVADLGTPGAVATRIAALSARVASEGKLNTATLDAKLGGLRGHTLIFTTHGLDVDRKLTPEEQKDTEGLLFHNKTIGRSNSDVVMMKFHLDRMSVQNGVVKPTPGAVDDLPDNQKIIADIAAFSAVVNAIRQSVFKQVYLAACGGDRRLVHFARLLHKLTGKTIFYSNAAIFMPTKPTKPFAEVGNRPKGGTFTAVKGFAYYGTRKSGTEIGLTSKTDTFLPGSTEREP
jgi:hypothetical protein